ncbi:hypothetical protein HY745_07480 [Candidatus Desantisbacteria bacterium]|nr:hypothetical protein [Candidatus Desantisbacteria bacterium]
MHEKEIICVILIFLGVSSIFYGIIDLNSFKSQFAGAYGIINKIAILAIIVGVILVFIGSVMLFSKEYLTIMA